MLVIVILLILVILFFAYRLFKPNNSKAKEIVVINEIKEYGYTLNDDDSSQYKKMFEKLKKILEQDSVDEEAYVEQISKMFVYDFFTLSDKDAKTDIGGKMFVYSSAVDQFSLKAENTIYKYVENNIYGTREQKLPSVKDIEIESIEQIPYDYQEQTDEKAYQVKLNWDYEEDLGYQDKATLIFVHENKKLSLIVMEE